MQEFSTKPHNTRNKGRKNGRCKKKTNGQCCNERAYGLFQGTAYCKMHYNDAVRLERRYINS